MWARLTSRGGANAARGDGGAQESAVKSGADGGELPLQEKVLFASVDVNALGVMLGPDASGRASVVKSMLTPLQVELVGGPSDGTGRASLDVGDILFAIDGELVHTCTHADILKRLRLSTLSSTDGELKMLVLSFTDPSEFFRALKEGVLASHALDDPNIFGKLKQQSGWRNYLPSWPFSRGIDEASLKSEHGHDYGQGAAYANVNAGDYQKALSVYSSVLEREPLSHTTRMSRSMCYLRLGDHEEALQDALICCALKPEWPMPYVCKGAALEAMDSPIEACSAYVCGLIVDPLNPVLVEHLENLFDRMGWSSISLDGKAVVGSVAATVMQHHEWGADLLVDRIVLYANGQKCLAHLFDFEPVVGLVNGGQHGAISVRVTDGKQHAALIKENKVASELYDGDEIITLNSCAVTSVENFRKTVGMSKTVLAIGVLSGARIAALKLLEAEFVSRAEQSLSKPVSPTLFCVHINGCKDLEANGVYVPQEVQHDAYVYENEAGYLFSFEKAVTEDSPPVQNSGWVLGRNGKALYAVVQQADDPVESISFTRCATEEFIDHMEKLHWQCASESEDLDVTPEIARTSPLPPLATLTGESIVGTDDEGNARAPAVSEASSDTLGTDHTPTFDEELGSAAKWANAEEWTANLQLLALKGYGLRAYAEKDFKKAEKCFDLVSSQVEPLLGHDTGIVLHATESSQSSPSTVSFEQGLKIEKEQHAAEKQHEDRAALILLLAKINLVRSSIALSQGNSTQAIVFSKEAIQGINSVTQEVSPDALYQLALAQAAEEQHKEAIATCAQALEACDNDSKLAKQLEGLKNELDLQARPMLNECNSGSSIHKKSSSSVRSAGANRNPAAELQALFMHSTQSKFTSEMKQWLTSGIVLKRVAKVDGSSSKKPKTKRLSVSGTTLTISTTSSLKALASNNTSHHIDLAAIEGVVKGNLKQVKPVPVLEPADECFTLVLRDGSLQTFATINELERDETLMYLVAWLEHGASDTLANESSTSTPATQVASLKA